MADISITAANVVAGSNASTITGTAGVAITAGQAVYKDPTTNKFLLADNDAVATAAHDALGIALNGAALNQPLVVQKGGDITVGAVLTAGVAYYLSATPGAICPVADLVTGKTVCQLGLAETTGILHIDVQFPGVTL